MPPNFIGKRTEEQEIFMKLKPSQMVGEKNKQKNLMILSECFVVILVIMLLRCNVILFDIPDPILNFQRFV